MINKKSQESSGAIIAIIFIILILFAAFLAVFGYYQGWYGNHVKKQEKPAEIIPTISIFAKILDPKGDIINSSFSVENEGTGEIIKEGKTISGKFIELAGMPYNISYRFCYWSENYYRQCKIYNYGVTSNLTIIGETPLEEAQKAAVSITSLDKIKEGESQIIRLNISARDGTIKRIGICTYHSVGIVYVNKPDINLRCPEWLNYTIQEGEQINFTDGRYWCRADDKIEHCDKIIANMCIQPNMAVPKRLKSDFCYYTGETLKNNDYIAELQIQSMDFVSPADYINFYIIDKELGKGSFGYDFYDSYNDGDVGAPDILYKLNFTY